MKVVVEVNMHIQMDPRSGDPEYFTPIYSGNAYLAMNFFAISATLDDIDLTTDDEIGIFDGDNCVGAGKLEGPIEQSFSMVASTDDPGTPEIDGFTSGNEISFRFYDASEGVEIANVSVSEYLSGAGIFSSQASTAFHLTGNAAIPVDISIDFHSGWNWFSLNVEGQDMSINNVLSSLTPVDFDFIKTTSASAQYFLGSGWNGGLSQLGVTTMYQIKLANSDNLVFSGAAADPGDTPQNISAGWNWISYIPQYASPINEALANISFETGDFIKSQSQSATYYEGLGWIGSLIALEPTKGYMIHVNSQKTLLYPEINCEDSIVDCAGVCGGDAVEDDCGNCDSDFSNDCIESENTPQWVDNPGAYTFSATLNGMVVKKCWSDNN